MPHSAVVRGRGGVAHPHRALEWLARAGLFTKGVVYALIGILAFQAAIGAGGRLTGARGVMGTIAAQPGGEAMLWIGGIGLCGYALWRVLQSLRDTEGRGTDAKGIAIRIGYFVSGLVYAGLGVAFIGGALGGGGGGGGGSEDAWTARLMAQPFGIWLVGIVGAIVVAVGLYQFKRAKSASFMRRLDVGGDKARVVRRLGQAGFAARGVTFGIIGIFLIVAAVQAQPQEARGLGGALGTLLEQPFGPWLLGLVALGLIAYGLYCVVAARYRRVRVS